MMEPLPSRCAHLPHDLDRRLEELEHAAAAAVVPGDAAVWAEGVLDRLEASVSAWKATRETWLAMTDEILDADPALAPRMEALRERLEEMDAELSSLRRALSGMCGLDGEVPADLERAEDRRRELLGWSVGCRSLGGEIDTWFTEAYYRDRGVGD